MPFDSFFIITFFAYRPRPLQRFTFPLENKINLAYPKVLSLDSSAIFIRYFFSAVVITTQRYQNKLNCQVFAQKT